MKNATIMAAAAVLAGTMALGCGSKSKDETTAADQPSRPTSNGMATPAMPTTTPSMGDKANSAMQSAGDKMNAAGQAMSDKMHATTMPSMPSMTPNK